ncbi:MAG: hypothetical protein AAF384_12525 [Pseudomonadota bacterium]
MPLSAADLGPNAGKTWQHYLRMLRTKNAHFEYLEELNEKAERGETRSLAEAVYLNQLLAEHDLEVKRFAQSMRALAQEHPGEHSTLLELLTDRNNDLGKLKAIT